MSWRARACNVAIRHGLRASIEGSPFATGVARFGRRMELVSALLPLPWSVSHESVRLAGVPCHWLAHAGSSDAPAVVVYLHGGGFVTGSPRTHRDVAWRLARAARARVLLVDYRLAPAHPFPAARDDVLAVLEQLEQSGVPASRIALAGDSAGGNLALSAALHLAECGRSPAALVLFSPWLDLAAVRMQPPLEHMLTADFLRTAAAAYAGAHEARDPRISPAATQACSGGCRRTGRARARRRRGRAPARVPGSSPGLPDIRRGQSGGTRGAGGGRRVPACPFRRQHRGGRAQFGWC